MTHQKFIACSTNYANERAVQRKWSVQQLRNQAGITGVSHLLWRGAMQDAVGLHDGQLLYAIVCARQSGASLQFSKRQSVSIPNSPDFILTAL